MRTRRCWQVISKHTQSLKSKRGQIWGSVCFSHRLSNCSIIVDPVKPNPTIHRDTMLAMLAMVASPALARHRHSGTDLDGSSWDVLCGSSWRSDAISVTIWLITQYHHYHQYHQAVSEWRQVLALREHEWTWSNIIENIIDSCGLKGFRWSTRPAATGPLSSCRTKVACSRACTT